MAPMFGWSYYSLEDGLVSCSVEYNEKSINLISYNLFKIVNLDKRLYELAKLAILNKNPAIIELINNIMHISD